MILLISHEELKTYKAQQLVPLECELCHEKFERGKADIVGAIKGTKNRTMAYCSKSCSNLAKVKRVKISCYTCSKEFEKTPKQVGNKNFCSRSCSVAESNKTSPRRRPEGSCSICGSSCSKSRKLCNSCNAIKRVESDNITIGEMKIKFGERSRTPGFISNRVREYSRRTNGYLLGLPCENCGYSKHTELCHIKAISSFNDDAKVSDINDRSNIANLCPNCHWEFDSGLLSLSDFRKS